MMNFSKFLRCHFEQVKKLELRFKIISKQPSKNLLRNFS